MKKALLLVCASASFGLAPFASNLGLVPGSAWLVLLGVAFALAASGSFNAIAVATGALGALGGTVLGSVSAAVGGAVLVALAYAERTIRVRSTHGRLLHVGAALGTGGLAGAIATAYGSASPAVRGVAVVVAAVLVALPLLVEADDPLAHALEGASKLVSDPARASLRDGAELRRQAHDIPLADDAAKGVQKTWRALSKLAEVRVRLERSRAQGDASKTAAGAVVDMVDGRIRDHVTALARAYTAADTVRAASVGLDDAALKTVENASEGLEDVSRALVDVDAKQQSAS